MPLKILLADDSATAQRLGKDYLAGAGHEVFTVSNGAAAMKKIAEIKPDVILVDRFMPGYDGLEVCEKVKSARETAGIPVFLTYSAVEPFQPEDAARVKADGTFVKPFDQAVLLAAVKKIEQKLKPAEPDYERTVKLTAEQIRGFQEDASYTEWASTADPHAAAEAAPPPEQQINVPQEMAAAPAFGLEELLADSPPAPAPPAFEAAAAPAVDASEAADILEIPEAEAAPAADPLADLMSQAQSPAADPFADFAVSAPEPAAGAPPLPEPDFTMPVAAAPPPPEPERTYTAPLTVPQAISAEDTQAIEPVLETNELPGIDMVQVTPEPLVEFTSAPQEDVAIAVAPGLEPTVLPAEESVFAAPAGGLDPALVTDATEMATAFPTRFGVENPDEIVVGLASDMPELYADASPAVAEPALDEPPEVAAELVAAMEAQPETIVPEPEAVAEPEPPAAPAAAPALSDADLIAAEMARAFGSLPPEPAPPEPAPATEPQIAAAMAAAVGAAAPAAASSLAAAAALDPATLADIVHRVTERVKTELLAELMRELEARK